MFVKKWPLEHKKIIKTYFPTYLRDSNDRNDGSDRCNNCDSSDSSDSSDTSLETTLWLKFCDKNFVTETFWLNFID